MKTIDKLRLLQESERRNQEHERQYREERKTIIMSTVQKRATYKLIREECCNLDPDGFCIPLDCRCPQLQSDSLICKWFQDAVLPLDKELHAEINGSSNLKPCAVCKRLFVPPSNRAQYCAECAAKVRRQKDTERKYANRHGK